MRQRIISALVLLPIVFGAIWFSYPFFDIMLVAAIVALAWEWDKMVSNRITVFAVINAALATCGLMMMENSIALSVFSFIVVVICLKTYFFARHNNEPYPLVKAFAPLYITLFAMAASFLENNISAIGIYWLLFIAFANDTGGMLVGCNVKGPKLCPSISPAKTWSGLFGGIILAVAVSVCFMYFFGGTSASLVTVALVTVPLALVATLGDLLESKIKRIVGVKDSGSLIPGHGGMFDRLDSIMLLMIVFALFLIIVGIITGGAL